MTHLKSLTRWLQTAFAALALAAFCQSALAQEDAAMQKVDLNRANAEALAYIPGIGAGKANAIIELRESRGGFKSIEELLDVNGIGERLLVQIKMHGAIDSGVAELTEAMKENPPRMQRETDEDSSAEDGTG